MFISHLQSVLCFTLGVVKIDIFFFSFTVVQVRTTYWVNKCTDRISEGKKHVSKSSYYFGFSLLIAACENCFSELVILFNK